uniref:Uncharacterized protein n=1 Tax=viral metagenome TaxID=1070528 RepID=A0A6C0CQ58_9ZZZZ
MVFTTNEGTLELHDINSYNKVYKTCGRLHLQRSGYIIN